ncbi:MAG: SIMPL domain-containing protein [Candidatus Nealsonbacteria bacterium]|nr:SIMPL domain-containing protein [Candidatus Nealsonbacteria bacterium]
MARQIALLLTLLLTLVVGTLRAEEAAPPRSISVSGTALMKAAPDQVVWHIQLTDFDKDMRKAKQRNDEKIEAVLALRKPLDIGEYDLDTGRLSINREYERTQRGERGPFKHYRVSRSVTIRQTDLKRFDEYLDRLVASSEMEVSFGFESSQIHKLRADTRLRAMNEAKKKAGDMARVVGAELGKVLAINEHSPNQRYVSPMSNASFSHSPPPVDAASDRFVPGAISVQVSVYVTFELK